MKNSILQQIFSLLILITILFLGSTLIVIPTVRASSPQFPSNRLSPQLANAVLQDLSHKVKIPVAKLKITGYSPKTWSDGCLGLPKPDEFCTQALVPGWHITLSDGHQTWTYRTDERGKILRLE